VGEVEARTVHAGLHELADSSFGVARGPKRADDLRASHSAVVAGFRSLAKLLVTVPWRLPPAELRLEPQAHDKRRVERPLGAIFSRLGVPIGWIGVHVTGGDAKPQAAHGGEGPIQRKAEPKADAKPGASVAVEQERWPDLEKNRLQQQVGKLVPSLLVEKEECWKEGAKVDAKEQMLARIGAPSSGEHDPGHVGHQEPGLAHDIGVGLSVEPCRTWPSAERERQPAIPTTIEPISLALRTGRSAKRREDQDRADDHPETGAPCHDFPMHRPAWRVKRLRL